MANQRIRHLFPGSNTCAGFMGFFEDLRAKATRTVILKGGPGVGKSTLMKAVGARLERQGGDVSYYHCSGDPDSLDAVSASGFLILDGTAPHIVDPRAPGAKDGILNLGVCLDEKQLSAQADAIEALNREIAGCYAQAYRYLTAAKALRADAAAVYDRAFAPKSRRALERELQSLLPAGPEGDGSRVFAQAITWKGVLQEIDSILTDTVYCIDAPWGFDAHALLLPLLDSARRGRVRRLACHDPLDAACLAHVQVGGALFTTAVLMDAPAFTPDLDADILRAEGPRLAFDKAVYDLTLNQAIEALAQAKQKHDALERYYVDAMDYNRLDEIKEDFLSTLPC
ncbi:MAG: hypothetical protein IJ662_00190 [Clostridia bacterium]|nr:hypothetical protein [Clostridia bacterium]